MTGLEGTVRYLNFSLSLTFCHVYIFIISANVPYSQYLDMKLRYLPCNLIIAIQLAKPPVTPTFRELQIRQMCHLFIVKQKKF